MKPVRVILSPEAEEAFRQLNAKAPTSKTERSVLRSIRQKVELIKSNPHYGEPVAKSLIPKEYVAKYGVSNLFWVGLADYWRMLYTLTNNETEIEIIAFVLDIMSHPDYDKRMGYKKDRGRK